MTTRHAVLALAAALPLALGACGGSTPSRSSTVTLQLWSHGGTDPERAALQQNIAAFESANRGVKVEVTTIPEGDYTTTLQSAVAAHKLPDVIDVDGPLVASFAAQGAFTSLEGLLSPQVLANQLETLRTQGTWHGKQWAVGPFDSGLGIWADRAALARAKVRVPTGAGDAWSAAEFRSVLAALARHDPDHKVLDLREDYGVGEWLTYGFSPLLSSAGGSLEDLSSPADLTALKDLGSWRSYVDPDADGKAFVHRRVALSWVGHWTYPDYSAALGSDLVLLPLPDLGQGSRTGSGSWAWALGAGSAHVSQGARLLDWLESDPAVLRMTQANGAIPGTTSALATSAPHAASGPLHLYVEQRDQHEAVPRPVVQDYPVITAAFSRAVHSVLTGTDPAAALAAAATEAGQKTG